MNAHSLGLRGDAGLERKFCQFGSDPEAGTVAQGMTIEGYASLFGMVDQGGGTSCSRAPTPPLWLRWLPLAAK